MRFQVEILMGLDAFIPVWDARRCRFSQPWGFSCNDPQDPLRCQTSLHHPHRIYHPAAHEYEQRAIKLCACWLLNVPKWKLFPHLVSDHHVRDLCLAVQIFVLLLIGENRENKVPWFALAFSHQKAPGFAFICQQFLCISPRQMSVVPPGEETVLG